MPYEFSKNVFKKLIVALNELEKLNILHRDLKPENILIDQDDNPVICDFGQGKIITPSCLKNPYVVSDFYRAPELFLNYLDYDYRIDVWAVGIIFAEL